MAIVLTLPHFRFALLINRFGERSATTARARNVDGAVRYFLIIRLMRLITGKRDTWPRCDQRSHEFYGDRSINCKGGCYRPGEDSLAQSSIATRVSREIKCGHPVRNISPCSGRRTADGGHLLRKKTHEGIR